MASRNQIASSQDWSTAAHVGRDGSLTLTLPPEFHGADVELRIRHARAPEPGAHARKSILRLSGSVTPRKRGVSLKEIEAAIADGATHGEE